MPFPFALPSTSFVSYPTYFSSTTHPLLPLTATNHRTVLRNALKKYRRHAPPSQPSNLNAVHSALTDYLPYLFALDAGLSNQLVANEEIDIALAQEPSLEWRATLTGPPLPGRDPPRIPGRGLDYELAFVLATLAYTHTLLARTHLHPFHAPPTTPTPTPDQRTAAITAATKHLLLAHAIHTYLLRALDRRPVSSGPSPVDISPPVQSALASVALAEATLLAVLKDDPYPAAAAQERNRADREWMVKAPDLPRVRAHLFARLCVAAAEHAGLAGAMLGVASGTEERMAGVGVGVGLLGRKERVDEGLLRYAEGLRRVARARACRFLGIDAELGGRMGEGIAWLRAGRRELGLGVVGGGEGEGEREAKVGLARLKRGWAERREERKVERGGGEWGVDGGVAEEGRVIDGLERRWVRVNDTVS